MNINGDSLNFMMGKRTRSAVIFCLFIFACYGSVNPEIGAGGTQLQQEYLPISVGQKWVLHTPVKQYSHIPVVLEVTSKVKGLYRIRFENPWVSPEWVIQPRGDRIYMKAVTINNASFQLPDNCLYFDFTAPVGKSWANAIGTITVLSRNATVKTRKGIFSNCIRFRETSKDGNQMFWTFAAGVGFVQFGEGPSAFVLTELTSSSEQKRSDGSPEADAPDAPSSFKLRGPMGIALSANPFANEPFIEESVRARVQQSREAGVNSMYISKQWIDIAKPGSKYDVVGIEDNIHHAEIFHLKDLLFTLRIVDTNNKSVPPDLIKRAFDDSEMWARLSESIDCLSPRLRGVSRINIGNEIDAYFGGHKEEVSAYLKLFIKTRDKIKQKIPGVQVGTAITFGGISNSGTRNLLRPLIEASDFLCLTYYPLNPDFTMRPPETVKSDFDKMREIARGLDKNDIVLQEVGYPSSALNNSSLEKQAKFFENVVREIQAHPDSFVFVNFFLMSDLPDWMVEDFAEYYKLPNVKRFKSYLKTLGIFDDKGRPKLAWDVLVSQLNR